MNENERRMKMNGNEREIDEKQKEIESSHACVDCIH